MKHLLLAAFFIVCAANASAQSCGNSGPSICTPLGTLVTNGYYFTPSEELPCISRNQQINEVIEFNFDSLTTWILGSPLTSLKFDVLGGLPNGLCWSTNATNDLFDTSFVGCIKITGVTSDPPGQYRLRILATMAGMAFPFPTQVDLDHGGFNANIYLRLIDQSFSLCPPVDTSQHPGTPYVPFSAAYQSFTQISGKTFFDVNQNQVFDSTDQPVRNQLLNIGNDYVALSNQNGNYTAYLPVGPHTVKPTAHVSSLPFNPDSLVVYADSTGINYQNNNFKIIPPPGYCAGALAIVACNPPPRPGFNNHVTVQFNNLFSATAVSQNIRFYYSSNQTFVTATPTPVLVDTLNRFMDWSVNNINPGTSWYAGVTLRTPTSVTINTVLEQSASVSNSSCSSLDTLTTRQYITVVGSYDPNDKAVSPPGEGANGHVLPSTPELTYTIRFQNTGTYLAENVRITDTISNYLNITSLKVLSASANYEVSVSGRQVIFQFNNINLPDSNSNEPNSHGYIQYSIKPNNTFVHSSVVYNTAEIYFDFNAPIVTNTTVTTADIFAGIANMHGETLQFNLYPNPATNQLNVTIDETLTGARLNICDVTGALITTLPLTTANYQLSTVNLPTGVYIAEIKTNEGVAKKRWVKM